ncbi:Hypothetical protein mma_2523 [Janthinobacterium sp. Marseille]|nr:Hypothetical protein mma_2523 [Janthinobacterium sp. Marseille]
MSLPFYSLKCDGCNLEQRFSYDTRYQFENFYDDEHQPILDRAWCKECDSIVTTANPITENSIADEVSKLNSWIQEERSKDEKGIFGFFKKKPNSFLILQWQAEIANLKMGVSYFHSRELKPICLTCGSNQIVPTKIDEVTEDNIAIGVNHSCGGQILASYGGRYSFDTSSLPIVKYDIDGKIVADTRPKTNKSNSTFSNNNQPSKNTATLIDEIKEIAKIVSIESVLEKGVYSGFLIRPNDEASIKLEQIKREKELVSTFSEVIEQRLSDNEFDDLLDHKIYEQYSLPSLEIDTKKSTAKRVVVGSNNNLIFQW